METNIEGEPSINVTLPEIYQSIHGRNRNKTIEKSPQRKKANEENLFIYKDFDTSLTAVKGPVKKLALLGQTTSKRGEDLIRDRLLSFNLRSGHLNTLDRGDRKEETMIERSAALKERKAASVAHLQARSRPRLSTNMRHKAFWVQN